MFPIFRNGTFLVVSQWKLRMGTYGWEQIQPSQPKETIFSTGFNFVFFLSFYSFSSLGHLRAIRPNALTIIELQKQEKRKPSHLDFCIDQRARDSFSFSDCYPTLLILRANFSLLHGFSSFASLFSRVVALF